jgi:hypothetical protein
LKSNFIIRKCNEAITKKEDDLIVKAQELENLKQQLDAANSKLE